ncbi:MAG: lipid-A-disaccharide synthase [Deltaproteobacteria bacterium]|nr:lipid-A-disaccharide synthase [Deltaproteobacteria bacterium]
MNGIFIIGGEESGDMHGASLIGELKKLIPGLTVRGMGGGKMREAGLDGIDSKEVSVVGIAEVAEKLPKLYGVFNKLKRGLAQWRPDAVVLIDFPDFNLQFAKEAKRLGIPVVYYISPQVWAWRKGRIKTIARLVNKMLVVFPFEEKIYRDAGVDVEYVGHPLVDAAACDSSVAAARRDMGAPEGVSVISLLPGSRTAEVRRLFPEMLKAAALIEKDMDGKTVFLTPSARGINDELLDGFIKKSGVAVRIVRGKFYETLRASNAAIVASGTATLETALIGTPMVIVYKISRLSYAIGQMLVNPELKYIGLPNIVAGRPVVPEFVQKDIDPVNIAGAIIGIIKNAAIRDKMTKGYVEIKERLGKGGAASRAAAAIKNLIEAKT